MSYIPSIGKSEFVCYIGLAPVMMVKKAGRLGFSLAVKLEGFAGEREVRQRKPWNLPWSRGLKGGW